ncbi:hypothetical protein [Fibrella aquatilis]|uniref:DUF3868 domain-containing protein n=1 Tax=Fibrella aquatilis TaxID=2817059 RepID=A0A939G5N0_9BACT|nr:hypothetical protein [Fibrella aquatilis]MBO0931490.1 hypothetical protein [Fibrella aquatilis]
MNRFYALFLTLTLGQQALAQLPTVPLFADNAPLSFTLTTQLQILNKDRVKIPFGEKAEKHPALLTMAGSAPLRLPVSLTVRGNFRRDAGNCIFPPLSLDLPKKKLAGTVFAEQNKLKLVTHCQEDNYIVREYLVYKLFNELTDLSFRARLAKITYRDSTNKQQGGTHWAFLVEDNDDVAKRNGLKLTDQRIKAVYTDSLTMATVGVFQYMIGNTDWSVNYQHNVNVMIDTVRNQFVAVPYDFDYAGIVETSYSVPDKQLMIDSVRDRIYRGPSYSEALLNRVFARFNEKKRAIYALYENNPLLEKTYIRDTILYLDQFYALINNPKKRLSVFGPGSKENRPIKGLND